MRAAIPGASVIKTAMKLTMLNGLKIYWTRPNPSLYQIINVLAKMRSPARTNHTTPPRIL
jgi:hypothetical protein